MSGTTSRPIVHQGIAQYFGGEWDDNTKSYRYGPMAASGLASVRAGYPKELNEKDAFVGLPAGRMSGAFMIVEMGNDTEIRQANAGAPVQANGTITAGGIKQINYQVSLDVYHISKERYAEDALADAEALVEAVKQRIRVDRTLGGICMDAGETRAGMKTIVRHSGEDASHRQLNSFSVAFEVRVNFIA